MKPFIVMLALVSLQSGAQVRRDPFARPARALTVEASADALVATPPAPPRLRAIMYEPGKSLVNIDGHILGVGDNLGDYRIAAIGPRSATLTRRGVRSVIVIDEESSK